MTAVIQPELFRALLRRHAAGVVVITVPGEHPVGFTVTSFTSVSLRPPLVSFCLDRASSSWPAVAAASYVGVHVLTDTQEALAQTFATKGVDRFAPPTRWHSGPYGVPVLAAVHAVLLCRVVDRVNAGDHAIVLSELVDGDHTGEATEPLLYHNGRYRRAA